MFGNDFFLISTVFCCSSPADQGSGSVAADKWQETWGNRFRTPIDGLMVLFLLSNLWCGGAFRPEKEGEKDRKNKYRLQSPTTHISPICWLEHVHVQFRVQPQPTAASRPDLSKWSPGLTLIGVQVLGAGVCVCWSRHGVNRRLENRKHMVNK